MRQMRRRRDPAPSRLAYRLHRLALTPSVRRLFTLGLPIAATALIAALTVADPDRRAAVRQWVADVKTAVQEREEFMVRLMTVDGASERVAEDIRAILPLTFPVSSFDLDLAAMQAKVASLDAVAAADLRVRERGVLEVSVRERVPALIWRRPDGLTLLDETGHKVRGVARRMARPDLPLIAGEGAADVAPEALELFATARPLGDRLRALVRIGARRWDVVLDRGQRILLPRDGAVAALEEVLALDEAQELLSREVRRVDMRNPERPTVRLSRPTAAALRQVKLEELGADRE